MHKIADAWATPRVEGLSEVFLPFIRQSTHLLKDLPFHSLSTFLFTVPWKIHHFV